MAKICAELHSNIFIFFDRGYNFHRNMDVGRDPARDHLAETIMVEAVAWSVKHSNYQKLLL